MRKGIIKGIVISIFFALYVLTVGCGKGSDTEPDTQISSETDLSEVSEEDVQESTEADVAEASEEDTQEEISTATSAKKELVYEELTDVSNISDNKYTCTYEGVKHDFIVYLPENTEGAPFVIMLHGYGESGEGFCSRVHFEEEACERGFAVIYVDGAADPNDTTSSSGWNSGISSGGNNDVAFLCSLAKYLQKEYSFNESGSYAAGFSNGAFMTHRLAMEASEVFTGVVSVAGKMPESIWNSKNAENDVNIFQVTGDKDDVVPKKSDGSADHMNDPAIEDVMAYWVETNGLKQSSDEEIGKGSVLTKYSGDGNKKVWNLKVKDGRHSWPEESIYGFDMNSLILDFLETE